MNGKRSASRDSGANYSSRRAGVQAPTARDFEVELETQDRTYRLDAAGHADREGWVGDLRRAASGCVGSVYAGRQHQFQPEPEPGSEPEPEPEPQPEPQPSTGACRPGPTAASRGRERAAGGPVITEQHIHYNPYHS